MKKSDLKTGMRVKLRNGEIYLVIKDVDSLNYGHQDVAFVNQNSFMNGDFYTDDLKSYRCFKEYDVVEVYLIQPKSNDLLNSNFMNLSVRFVVWKREEYTNKQKEIFKALKALGYKYIARDKDGDLFAYEIEPRKGHLWWYADKDGRECELDKEAFKLIKWEDSKPFEIPA